MFAIATYSIYRFEQLNQKTNTIGEEDKYSTHTLSAAVLIYISTAAIVIGSAIWLSAIGDRLTDLLGLDESFMGTQFLAAATSLPELTSSVVAIRIAAPELAITNLLGSNLFNIGVVLLLNDVAYTHGVIWVLSSQVHILTMIVSIFMEAIVVLAVVSRPRTTCPGPVTSEAAVLTGFYTLASFLGFQVRLVCSRVPSSWLT